LEVIGYLPYICNGINEEEGNGVRSLLYLPDMNSDSTISTIEEMVKGLLADEPQYFIVDLRIKPTNNVKLYLDGDQGITIEKCISYNRALYKLLLEASLFPEDDFSLEVSSPGLDEPLKWHRQYLKNVGRPVEVLLLDGVKIEGKMTEVSEEGITVEETRGKNKKKEVITHNFLFNNIKSTKLQVVF